MSGRTQPHPQVQKSYSQCFNSLCKKIVVTFGLDFFFFCHVYSWENKDVYARAVCALRLRELQNVECMTAVRAGLASIIPLQLLTMLSPLEMELRTCGLPYINLEFLKVKIHVVTETVVKKRFTSATCGSVSLKI